MDADEQRDWDEEDFNRRLLETGDGEAEDIRVDHAAARVHRRLAEEHYIAAEKFRRLGLSASEQAARTLAKHEDETAELLETGRERRRQS